ncbi:MAG: preQ(1) synthase [Candidatus Hydrogenedens sp.]
MKKKKDITGKVKVIRNFKPQGKTLPFKGPEAIESNCLECFEYEYKTTESGRNMEIVSMTDEFTSVCPFSGLPDFAKVTIRYVPDRYCLELRSLKYYLLSYRDVGIWYEHLVNRMLEDLVFACRPRKMTVVIECNPRGGIASTVSASYDAETMGSPEKWKGYY